MNDWLWRGLATSVGAYGAALDGMLSGQRALMYFPDPTRPAPAEVGVPEMAEITLSTADGLALAAWYRPPRMADLPTLVYFHGNAGHIGMRAFKARPYLDAGFGVLLTTWRGFSGNPGRPDESGLYADGRAALSYVNTDGVPDERLVLYGESLGTGIAIQLATEIEVAAIVLEAPFSSIPDVAQARMPMLPVRPLILDRFDSHAKVRHIAAPLLIVHGEQDATVPAHFGRKLFEAAGQPKDAVFLPDAGHNDLYDHGMAQIVIEYLGSRLGPIRSAP